MAYYFYKGKVVRSRSDRDRDVKLLWAHTVTLKHTDVNFRVSDSVATQLRANFVFPGTWDEFVGDDFYWSQFSLGQLRGLPNKIDSRSRLLGSVCWCGFHRVSMAAM